MDDPDAMWKPGYDGPPPIASSIQERASEPPPAEVERAEPADGRSRGWWVGVGVAVVVGVLLIGAVVVVDPLGSGPEIERPDASIFGGPAARRLPLGAATLWSVDLDSNGDHWVDVIGRDLVIAAVAGPIGTPTDANGRANPVTTIIALDAPTGLQRWTLQLPALPGDVAVIGAVDDVLVLEQPSVNGPTVVGVDVATGETRWSATAAPTIGHVGLVGTRFIARLPSPSDRFVALIDARSGRDVGTITSEPMAMGRPGGWSTDRRGKWHVLDDGELVEYDLSTELGVPTVIGRVDDISAPRIVLGNRLGVVDESGVIRFEEDGARSPVTASGEIPQPARSLTPVSGSNFVVTSPGSIAGVAIEGDTSSVTWTRNEGAVVDDHPVVGGTLLQVADNGGAETQLIDGLTGETVEYLTVAPGALRALVVAGDGIVALRSSEVGAQVAGINLDGTERWTIPGATPVIVGDRIVVRATANDRIGENATEPSRRVRITAHGDAE